MIPRLIAAALWLAVLILALWLIDEERHRPQALLTSASSDWCDLPNSRDPIQPTGPRRPFQRKPDHA